MRRRPLLARAAVVALIVSTLSATVGTSPASAAAGITVRLVKGGLNGPAAFTFAPEARCTTWSGPPARSAC